ncbi:MAG: glycosyltransferase family 1 protein, partial [Nitrospinota bacterium]
MSTRFAGTDGVSLESEKWATVLQEEQHAIFWYAGRLDRDPAVSFCIPEAFFGHPENQWISERIWGKTARPPLVSRRIHELAGYLKSTLYEFVRRFDISLLILENALSIPMHIPLGAALTEYLAETEMPAIAHHHDFYWERSRFLITGVDDYLEMAFPPRGGGNYLQHAVINQSAREELAWRKGVPA